MNGGPDVHIPPDWDDAAAQVADAAVRRVLVLGAADVGKSTFCRFLLGHLRARGRRTGLLDTDVGQKTVGPPACVPLAGADRTALFFVGTTDPVRGWRRILDGTGVLLDATESDVTVINTSGLLAGPGRRLKADKIAVVRPDLLIALGSGSDLERVVGDHASVPVVRLTRSPAARRKTKAARRAERQRMFGGYFRQASVRAFARGLVPEALQGQVQAGVLVGLADAYGTDLGLGIVANAVALMALNVLTPVAPGGVHQVTPSLVCLGQDFSELRLSEP